MLDIQSIFPLKNYRTIVKERVDKISQVQGLGLPTIAAVIAETGGFALFTSRGQLTSYSGYDVVQNESGTSIKGKLEYPKKEIST